MAKELSLDPDVPLQKMELPEDKEEGEAGRRTPKKGGSKFRSLCVASPKGAMAGDAFMSRIRRVKLPTNVGGKKQGEHLLAGGGGRRPVRSGARPCVETKGPTCLRERRDSSWR